MNRDGTTVERTRLLGSVSAGVLAGATGVFLGNTTIVFLAAIPFAFAAYGRVGGDLEPDLAVERALSADDPRPGETVTVTLTVRNVGKTALADVRIADRVPPKLQVIDGETRLCCSLAPGEDATLSYTVRARRGEFHFGEPAVVVTNATGTRERFLEPGERTTLTCRAYAEQFPLADQTTAYAGDVETDTGGEGVEFFSLREYQSGDPMGRIDFKRMAGGEGMKTVEFREERAAAVVVVVDTSEAARTYRTPSEPTGLELSRQAAEQIVEALLDNHNRVGVALYGREDRYLAPGAGRDQSLRITRVLDGDTDIGVDTSGPLRTLRKRLPPDIQIIYCSPLLADDALALPRRLSAHGYRTSIVSPDVTDGATVGATVARLNRELRTRKARREGFRVVDWPVETSLEAAISRARHRWST